MKKTVFNPRFGYFGLTLLVLMADQASKFWAFKVLRFLPEQNISLIPGFFSLSYAQNTGIAFSLFGNGTQITRWALLTTACLAAIGVVVYSLRTSLKERWLLLALAMILGGIVGNALDRVIHGAVIDFLHVYWREYHWPIFNVADSFICIGAGLLALDVLLSSHRIESPSSQPASCPEPQDS